MKGDKTDDGVRCLTISGDLQYNMSRIDSPGTPIPIIALGTVDHLLCMKKKMHVVIGNHYQSYHVKFFTNVISCTHDIIFMYT